MHVTVRRPTLVIAVAVVLCLPMVPAFLAGTLALVPALERFLLALTVSWIGLALISRVVTTYSHQARRAEIIRQLEEARESHTGRTGSEAIRPNNITTPEGMK